MEKTGTIYLLELIFIYLLLFHHLQLSIVIRESRHYHRQPHHLFPPIHCLVALLIIIITNFEQPHHFDYLLKDCNKSVKHLQQTNSNIIEGISKFTWL
uniref:Uncharacterized protein n=1 Tax=Tetranychus urticae TaxID=32264 RepID=T1KSV4_TETUR